MIRTPPRRRSHIALAAVLLGIVLVGCSGRQLKVFRVLVNQPPRVRLTEYPASSTSPYFYVYELSWTGYDPDGRVDHYMYVVDPPTAAGADTPWVSTTDNRVTLTFRSTTPDSSLIYARGFHVFALKAVDNQGASSATEVRAFYSYTVAPTVQIATPRPNHLLPPALGVSPRISWTGTDPDGRNTNLPVKYKWKLFSRNNTDFDFLVAVASPDSIRRFYAPNFSSWDSTGPDTTFAQLSVLLPGEAYLFVVVAFDEAGAYSPVFAPDLNMIYFTVGLAQGLGPRITLFNSFFIYTYATGGFYTDPTHYVNLDVPADQPVQFNWFGNPGSGASMEGYRWCMDIADLFDETRRSNQFTDVRTHLTNIGVAG